MRTKLCAVITLACAVSVLGHTVLADTSDTVESGAIEEMVTAFVTDIKNIAYVKDLHVQKAQVLAYINNSPLRLGPLGKGITKHSPFSLTGQVALSRFYAEVEQDKQAVHEMNAESIRSFMTNGRDGSPENPYRSIDINDARMLVYLLGYELIGARYREGGANSLYAELFYIDEIGHEQRAVFDIEVVPLLAEALCTENTPCIGRIMRHLAENGDSAADALMGWLPYLQVNAQPNPSEQDRLRNVNSGIGYLKPRVTTGNASTYDTLASLVVIKAELVESEQQRAQLLNEAREYFRIAISAGLLSSVNNLARLYLRGTYGASDTPQGMELLEQAVNLGDADAAVQLGWLYFQGLPNVPSDESRSKGFFKKGRELGDLSQGLEYTRFLIDPNSSADLDVTEIRWLTEKAREQEVDAMLMLGNIHARGHYKRPNLRRAKRWYLEAAKLSPDNPDTINEVAWVLATTNIPRLRDPDTAVKLMNEMMLGNALARRTPMYLDTWAAAYAAIAKFDIAVSLQEEALARVNPSTTRPDIVEEMQEHLAAFRADEQLHKDAP